ncbi:unnamed protein product [Didymodactylos carnosus]|uniref:Zinc finger C2H2 LYAR-type domain-containing protein n=1 Tax=Didymodactylos carnosus TaxID=1234261 RepID=A0A813UCE5_9BILA|nr:unnamed protein product [Didymodactylos carnosus]CAF3611459.1 unnamed protein product [Didymodactylos carnosus]
MVVFHCNGCGEALKKSQVDKHLLTACRSAQSVSCVDCGKDFGRQEYQNHVKCVSEQQKYGGANYVANSNSNKGEKKQEGWFEIVQSAINQNSGGPQAKNLLQKLQNYPNTPRKRAKFINFVSNSIRGFQPRIVEEVWTILEALLPKIMKRYKKLKPSEEKEFNDIEKKLEKKLRRAPFIETLDNNIYRLLDEAQ